MKRLCTKATNAFKQKNLFSFFLLFVLLTAFGVKGWGQVTLPHLDPLNYTVGQSLTSQSGWSLINTATSDLTISSGNLTYSGLVASSGNKIAFSSTGEDAAKTFTQQTSGTIYYSFLLNITALGSLNSTGGYFTNLVEGTTTTYGASVWTRLNNSGYDIGINPRTTAANTVWSSSALNVNTTYFIVISYQIVSGTANDVVKLWINPTPGNSEPSATLSATNTGTDLANLNRILIRQDAANATPNIEMDELRIGTTWASVTPASTTPTITANPTTLSGFTYVQGSGPSSEQSFTISGSNLTANISITPPTNYEISTGTGGSFAATSPITLTQSGGTVNSTNIYVRLKAGLSSGNYNSETISASSAGATTQNVTCSGTVTAGSPTISTTGSLSAVNTTYGTASASPTTFSVSGTNMTAGILVTPPSGYEVSLSSGSGYGATVTVGAAGTIASTAVYVRLKATTAVGSYSGNVVCSSSGATSVNVATVSSTVSAKSLTITANDVTKAYGSTLTGGSGSTAFTSNGLVNSETIGSVTIAYGSGAAAGDAIGTYTSQVTPSAATGGTFTSSNYSITYVAGTITVVATANVFISEYAGAGYGNDYNNEYIELTNNGSASQSLTGWTLLYYNNSALEETINLSGTIAVNSAYLIAMRSGTTTINGVTVGVSATNSAMNSTGYVVLKNASSTVVDQAGASGDKFADNKNFEFTNCTGDNLPVANWTDLGTGNGTPGVVNCDCSAPTTQASSFGTNTIAVNSMNVTWTRGNGTAGVIVVARAGSAVNADPVSGTDYTPNSTFSSGTQIGTGNYVVYKGTGTSVSVSGLVDNTTYYYAIYEYNTTDLCYNKSELTGNATTLSCAPSTQSTSFSSSSITTSGMTIGWTRGNGTAGVIVVARSGSAVNADPVSGTDYTANSAFSSGAQIGSGNYVVYKGSGNNVSITGLSAYTTYYYAIYEYNTDGICYNMTELTGNSTTLCTQPTTQASSFVSSSITSSGMTIGWTRGNGTAGVLVVARSGGAVNTDPTSGTNYTANASFGSGTQIGSGNYVVYKGTGTSVSITGLSETTTYYYAIYEYNTTGTCFYAAELTGNATTTANSACGTQTFSGGITPPAGWTFTAIGGTYSGSACSGGTSLKMDATGDAVETATVNNPTELSFNILGNGLSVPNTTSELLVQGWNGTSWVTIENITGTGLTNSCQAKTYNSGLSSYTKFKFTYTKGTGNLSFDDVSITCAGGPTITTTGTISAFGNVCTNTTTAEKSYTVTGTLLTDDIIITPPVGYEVSKTSGSGFVANPSTLTLTQSGGNVATTTIYVRFVPTAAQSYNDIISNSSIGATDKNVSVSGTGVASMAPTVTTQTSASVGTTTATLGGNITVTGCSNVTERGIYWSTTDGFANGTGTKVSVTAGPYSTGVFTQAVTGLTANTVYYYKAFATSADGTGYTSQGTFTTLKAEPTAQPTNFAVGGVTTSSIPLSWTAASPQPDQYLIKLSTAPTAVVDPVDGTDPADVTAISSGVANKKTGTGAVTSATTFTGMTAGTMYNYKIYSLNNSGTNVDFLLTGAPALNHATLPNAVTGAGLTATGSTTADISWTAASGYNSTNHSTLVFVKATSTVTPGTPTNAPSAYTANTVFGSGTAYQNDASAKCVYKGDGTSVSITGLSASTTYYVLIYTVVDASNSNATNSYSSETTAYGMTSCVSVTTLPYTQNFDASWSVPSDICWSSPQTGNNQWHRNDYTTGWTSSSGIYSPVAANSSTKSARFHSYNAADASTGDLISPVFDFSGYTGNKILEFYYINTSGTDKIDIYLSTNGGSSYGASLQTLTTSSAWTKYSIGLGSTTASNVVIKITATSDYGTTDIGLDEVVVKLVSPEPANHPTSFACGTTTSSSIPLTWTDATGTPAPDGYLIKWSTTSYTAITAPADATAEADGTTTKNISQGTQAYSPTGLSSGTTYYFKIWSYTNSGTDINYKTDGTIQQTSCTTQTGACMSQSFEGTYPPASWTNSGTSLKTSGGCAGSKQAQFDNAGDYLITPALSYPSQLTFQYKRSGDATAWSLKVQYCATVGGTYTDITTISNATTNCQTATVNLPSGCSSLSTVYLKFLDTRSSGANERYIDDINVFCSVTSCSDPTLDASSITFSSVSNASMTVNWTNGDGARRLVVAREGSAVSFSPTDNTTYASTSDFSAGTDLGSGNKVVYSGTASSFTLSGLNGGSTYYFKVFEYNCTNGLEQYYTSGTPATASQTCKPNPVTNLDVTCMTNGSAIISWTPPDGSYDGVIISMRNSTNDCHAISNDASSYSASTTFGSGTSYGGTTPYSFVVYKGTGTSVTVNAGLTAGQPYKIMAYTYKNNTGSLWSPSSPTTSITALGLPNVSSLATAPANAQVQVTWTNPVGSCWEEVMVVAKATSAVTASPSGDGSAYSANAAFGSGTAFDGGYVVYKGTGNNISVTALTNGSSYCFKVFIRSGTSWSSGTYDCETPVTGTTTMVPGSIAVLGVCSNTLACGYGSNSGDDEFSIVTFQDITPGTTLDMTDNGWEKCASGYWGNTEGYMRIKRTSGTIPAGTIITFRLNQGTGAHFTGIYPDNNWSIEIEEGSLIMNSYGDQVYFLQGGVWNQGTVEGNDATYTGGTFLFAFNTNNSWTSGICSTDNNNTGSGRSQNSGLYDEMECFNMMPSIRTDYLKYSGDMTATTQRGWIERIKDADNWNGFTSCASYYAASPDYASTTSIIIAQGGGGYTAGLWTGAASQDWFNCGNWGNLLVPDKDVDVVLPANATYTATNNCVIGAPPAGFTAAACKNFSNSLSNFAVVISNTSSKLDVYGNFTNSSTFTHSNGLVTFKGTTAQSITGTPIFYDLTLDNSAGLTIAGNIQVTNNLTLSHGVLTTNSNTIDLGTTGTIYENYPTTLAPSSYVTGNVKATRIIGGSTNQTFGGLGVEINETGGSNLTVVTRTTGSSISAGAGSSITRYFDITPATNNSLNATLVFHYFDHEIGGYSEADLELFRAPSPYNTWYSQTGTVNSSLNTTTKTAITAFSRWTLANKNSPLPVSLLNFSGDCEDNKAHLTWTTASETNNDYFSIEKSLNMVQWNLLAKVDGAGNANYENVYSYIDADLENNPTYYRLKQTDYNGISEVFDPISVSCRDSYREFQIFPNPATSTIFCTMFSDVSEKINIEIINAQGSVVNHTETFITAGDNKIAIDLAGFESGMYYVLYKSQTGEILGRNKMIIQKQ